MVSALMPADEKPVDRRRLKPHSAAMNLLTRLLHASLLTMAATLLPDACAVVRPVVIGYYHLDTADINQYRSGHIAFPVSRITPEQARMLTHINFSFIALDQQGRCSFPEGTDSTQAAGVLQALRQLKRFNHGLRILFSLGGWSATNDDSPGAARYRQAAATTAARSQTVASCIALMRKHGLDGIDIDWEYPRADDAAHFVALLQEFRQQLDRLTPPATRRRYQLTMAAAGGAFNLARTYTSLPAIAAQLDYINLMTYDLNGPWEKKTGHNAHLFGDPAEALFDNPLRAVQPVPAEGTGITAPSLPSPFALTVDAAVQQYLQAGVPPGKLVLGVPFYGRAYFEVAPEQHGLHQPFNTPAGDDYHGDVELLPGCASCLRLQDPRLPAYADIRNMLAADLGYVRYFSEDSKVPWLYHPQQHIFVSYEDAESLRYKVAYLRQYHLAGVMFWHLGQDDTQATLLRTLHQALHQPPLPADKLFSGHGLRYLPRPVVDRQNP